MTDPTTTGSLAASVGGSSPRSLRMLYAELGRALSASDRNDEAIAAFEQALEEPGTTPSNSEIVLSLTSARTDVGDFDGALGTALGALLDGNSTDLELVLERALQLTPRARLAANRALLSDPRWRTVVAASALSERNRANAGLMVGRALLDLGEPGAAEAILAATATVVPDEAAVHHLRGRALQALHRHPEALSEFDRAYERARARGEDSLADTIAVTRARALLDANQLERAVASLPDPLPDDPRLRGEGLIVRATGLLRHGLLEDAEQTAAQAATLSDHDLSAYAVRGQALMALHRSDDAIEVIDRALDRDPTREDLQVLRWAAQVEGQIGPLPAENRRRQIRHIAPETIDNCLADPFWQPRADDGRAHYARAELFYALGDSQSVLSEGERALELGLGEGLPPGAEAPVHALLATALEEISDRVAAAQHRFEAGRAYYYAHDWPQAVTQLQDVLAQQPDHPDAPWYLASALDAQALTLVDPIYAGAGNGSPSTSRGLLLANAQNVWDEAAATRREIPAWAFGARAAISEDSIRFAPAQRADLLWTGVVFLERGLLKDPESSFLWMLLGRIYRILSLDASASVSLDRAMEVSPSDVAAIQETLVLVGNAGDYDRTLSLVERREALIEESGLTEEDLVKQRSWHLAIRAVAAEGLGDYDKALRLASESLGSGAGAEGWVREVVGRAYRMLGKRDASVQVFRDVLAEPPSDDPDRQSDVAEAHFALGQPDEAVTALHRWLAATGRPHRDIELNLGLCELLQGEIDQGERTINQWIDERVDHDGPRGLRYGLRVVDEEIHEDFRADARSAGERLMARLDRAIAETSRELDPDGELTAVFAYSGADDTRRAGAAASLGRRAREQGDWNAAAEWYGRLAEKRELFPEANDVLAEVAMALEQEAKEALRERGPEAVVQAIDLAIDTARRAGLGQSRVASIRETLGDEMVRLGHIDSAVAQYEDALRLVSDGDAAARIALQARIAIADHIGGRSDGPRRRFDDLLKDYARSGEAAPERVIGVIARSILGSTQAYTALDSEWARASTDESLSPESRQALAAARGELAGALDGLLDNVKLNEELLPVVTPIVLEIGSELVPLVDDQQDGGTFLFGLVPEMRERIRKTTGVDVPGVRGRGASDLLPNQFSVQVDETTVLKGSLNPADKFVVSSGVRPDAEVSNFHPLTGEAGVWAISDADGEHADLSAPQFLVYQIERVLRDHLGRYLGPQEVDALVIEWSAEDAELVNRAAPDVMARLRLTWVLQALATDGVPIADWRAVLTAFSEAGAAEVPTTTVYRAVRRQLVDKLPGPRTGLVAVAVPDELAAALVDNTATARRAELRSWLRQTVLAVGPAVALIVASDEARDRADALARPDHPLMRTLTREELGPAPVDLVPAQG